MNKVTILAPATVANLVCGFDVLGLALHEPCDRMSLQIRDTPGIHIINEDQFGLPDSPSQNVAGVALQAMLEKIENPPGIELRICKKIKPGSGIGSSAASSAGAVVALNYLLGHPFSRDELTQFAMNGEKLASGVKHADNIAPCIYGGVTLIRSIHPLDIIRIQSPPLFVTVVHPQIEVRTADARQILKKQILLRDAIRQWGNIAGLVAGFEKGDYELIGRSLEDVLIEPIRSILIPAFDEVKKGSLDAGALGGGISGSGPSIFMLSKDVETARGVEKVMANIYSGLGIEFNTYVTTVNTEGIRLEKPDLKSIG